jgi:hypothetical protein
MRHPSIDYVNYDRPLVLLFPFGQLHLVVFATSFSLLVHLSLFDLFLCLSRIVRYCWRYYCLNERALCCTFRILCQNSSRRTKLRMAEAASHEEPLAYTSAPNVSAYAAGFKRQPQISGDSQSWPEGRDAYLPRFSTYIEQFLIPPAY